LHVQTLGGDELRRFLLCGFALAQHCSCHGTQCSSLVVA